MSEKSVVPDGVNLDVAIVAVALNMTDGYMVYLPSSLDKIERLRTRVKLFNSIYDSIRNGHELSKQSFELND